MDLDSQNIIKDIKPVEFDPFDGPEIIRVAPAIEPQLEIWIACLMGGEDASRSYNESVSLTLTGVFDRAAMERALQEMTIRHEALRSAFSADGKQICIYREQPLNLDFADLSFQSADERQRYIKEFRKKNALTSFDLLNGPLFRAALFKLGEEEHYLTLTAHHIICDGWSLGIIMQDLSKLYSAYVRNQVPDLPPALRFSAYSEEQWTFLQSDAYKKIEQYWIDLFKDGASVLDLPTDYPRPADRTYKSHRDDFPLDQELVSAIKKMGAKEGCSLVTTLMAAYEVFLHRLTGQTDVVLGVPAAGQSTTGNYALVGHCVNLLPLRSRPGGDTPFIEYLKQRKARLLDDYDHQQFTFGRLLKKLNVKRDASRVPLVPLVFNIDMGLDDGVSFEGLKHKLYYNPREYESFEIFINASGSENSLILEWSYNTQLFKATSINRMMDEFESLLWAIVQEPVLKIKDIPLFSKDKLLTRLHAWNATDFDYPREKALHYLIGKTAAEYPDKTAIRFEDRNLTYKQLNESSNQLAALLLEQGIKPGDVVGVAVNRSPEMIISLLAILKAGAAYVPLDPLYPKDRIRFMMEDSSAKILITSQQYKGHFQSGSAELLIETAVGKQSGYLKENPDVPVSSDALAYVLYTSGSTGKPKGVMVEHRNLVNLLYSMQRMPGISVQDRLLAVTTISFDIAGLEIFLPLLTGAELVLTNDQGSRDGRMLTEMVKKENISIIQATPATYKMMLDTGWEGKSDLRILCCGEPMSRDLAKKLISRCAALYNMYGPTETTIYSTGTQIFPDDEIITIGRPIGNTQVYILDKYGNPLPEGIVGEIYLGGDGVTRGYLNRPEIQSERFVNDSFSGRTGRKMYRTGDLGKFLEDGKIQCLGRIDQQIKIRGYRIEPEEIEHNLTKLEGIKEAVVMVREDRPGDQRLVAYLLVKTDVESEKDRFISRWREALKKSVPFYMVPNDYVFLSRFPLTPSGKIDRKLLPEPEFRSGKSPAAALRNSMEERIAGIWSDLLGADKVGFSDDFFELGGHSLIAAQVMGRLEKETGRRLPLTTLFKYPVLEQFAALFTDKLDHADGLLSGNELAGSGEEPERISVPAIEPQLEIWLSCVIGGEDANRSYNISMSEHLLGKLDRTCLERALQELINRHESLRATFSENGREIRIDKKGTLHVYFEDLSSQSAEQQESFISHFSKQNAEAVFDLLNGPLHRFALFKLGDERHYLTFTAHHIICDGWSFGIIMREIGKLYSSYVRSEATGLPDAPRFSQYAEEQQQFYGSPEYKKIQQYWVDQFKNGVPVLDIPTDFKRPSTRTYKSHRDDYPLDKELVSAIRKMGTGAGCTLAITLRVAFEIFLYRLTGQNDIVLGLPAAGQLATDNYDLVGHCVNLLPLRSRLNGEASFIEYLKQRKIAILDAYDNQQLTFGSLLKDLNIARDRSRVPLVPVAFNIELGLDDAVYFQDLKHEMVFNSREYETFDISLNTGGTEESPTLQWSYNIRLFHQDSIRSMMEEFEFLLRVIVKEPEIKIGDIPVLLGETPVERHLFSHPNKTIVDLFSEQVKKTPHETAVVFENDRLTYRELDELTNRLGHYLQRLGVGAETLVPVCIERSLNMLVGILGILKAGGAYVPIDPEYPVERIYFMLGDTASSLVLSSRSCSKKFPMGQQFSVILLEEIWTKMLQEPITTPVSGVSANGLAYVIYTSGSTGKPKGVLIEHKNVVSLVRDVDYVQLSDKDVLLSTGSPSFDATTFEYWGMLLNGGQLVLCSEQTLLDAELIKKVISARRVNIMWFTSSLLNQWVSTDITVFKGLKTILTGGEKLSEKHIEKLRSVYPEIVLINGYGPTENTTFSLTYPIKEREITRTIPIGKPLNGRTGYVLDKRLRLIPIGAIGELYVGGSGVGRGYLNRPELTSERFLPDPFSPEPGAKMYRTGDRARYLPDGNIVYLDRMDDQVKIRGFRIELGEIEQILLQHNNVVQAVVIIREDSKNDKRLIAYIVPEGKLNKAEVMNYLQSKLPAFMVPRQYVELSKIPLTPNGKADKKLLPDPDLMGDQEYGKGKRREPQTENQKLIAGIWTEELKLRQLSIDDDFFEIGGHSLIAVRVMKSIEEKTGRRLPITTLFEAPTVEKLSLTLELDAKSISWKSLVPIKREGNKPPLYIVHGSGLTVMVFHLLAWGLDADQPVYGLQARGLNGIDEPFDTMEDIAKFYVSEILEQNPTGPYNLAGYSFGGIVAFEMVKQLEAMGKKVNMLAIFDTYADNSANFDDWYIKMTKKFIRQFPKFRFIFRSLIKHPGKTLNYQLNRMRSMLNELLLSLGLSNKRHTDDEERLDYADKIEEKHDVAFERYRMEPYNGTIDLFRVKSRLNYLDDPIYLGWKPFALKGLNIYDIPGDHKTFLFSPNVQELAVLLQRILNERNREKEIREDFAKPQAVLKAI